MKGVLGMDKLNELTDEELRNKILDMNDEQLYKIVNMSYYFFISRSVELIQLVNGDSFLHEIEPQQEKQMIIKSFDTIVNTFEKLFIEMMEKEIDENIVNLLNIRKELYDLSNALYGYEIELSYIKELLDHHTMKVVGEKEYEHVNINKQEITLLINKIGKMLAHSTTDHIIFVSIVSNILSIIPFRMSKSKYFDVVKTTIIRNSNYNPVSLVENQIEKYKILLDSSLNGDYGITFANYFTSIQKLKNINLEDLNLDELENMAKSIIDLTMDISELRMFINNLGILVNRLIIIFSIKNKVNFNSNMKDIFLTWEKFKDELDKNLLDSLIKESNKELTKLEKQLLNDIEYLQVFNEEGLKRTDFFDDKLNKEMLFTKKVLTYYNDMQFTKYEVLFPESNEIIDGNYLEQLAENLIQYINRSIVTMNNMERKIRMRRLLSILELPFVNIQEFLSYIEYSLDERIVSKEEILFTIDAANYWLDGIIEEKQN